MDILGELGVQRNFRELIPRNLSDLEGDRHLRMELHRDLSEAHYSKRVLVLLAELSAFLDVDAYSALLSQVNDELFEVRVSPDIVPRPNIDQADLNWAVASAYMHNMNKYGKQRWS